MKQIDFDLWKSQSVEDLRAYRESLEKEKVLRIQPIDARIAEVDGLIEAMKKGQPEFTLTPSPKPAESRRSAQKGRRYAYGTHWTQRPENAQKVSENARKGALKRNAQRW